LYRRVPERSVELESGFDADLFGDRATLIVTHANKQNKNTLINRTPPPSSGTTSTYQQNLARVVNRRTEIQLTTRVIERPGLSARVTANLSIYDNRIKTLGDGVTPFGANEQRYVAGYPVGALWMRPILGVNDANGDGRLDNSEVVVGDSVMYVGSPAPRYTAGYNLELTVLNLWTVNALIGYKGKYMQNRNQNIDGMRGYWDPRSSLADQALIWAVNSAGFHDLQSLSEVRLQSASVTMNVPPRLAQKFRARSMQLSLQGSNLGLWTQYRGRDPGVNASPVGERVNDDGGVIAPPRGFSLQLRLGY
jgi:hypothetical protein